MTTQGIVAAFAILGTSFMGSWHCAAMCGSVSSLMVHRKSQWSYHLGRGLSYALAGALGGFLGSFSLASDYPQVQIISGVVFAVILLIMGVQTLRGEKAFFSSNFKIFHKLYRPQMPGVVLGLLSVLLPCGWLYSYVLAASATRSPLHGAAVMSLFWLAGIPALASVSVVAKKTFQWAPDKKRKIIGAVLVAAGLYSLISFYFTHHNHCG